MCHDLMFCVRSNSWDGFDAKYDKPWNNIHCMTCRISCRFFNYSKFLAPKFFASKSPNILQRHKLPLGPNKLMLLKAYLTSKCVKWMLDMKLIKSINYLTWGQIGNYLGTQLAIAQSRNYCDSSSNDNENLVRPSLCANDERVRMYNTMIGWKIYKKFLPSIR